VPVNKGENYMDNAKKRRPKRHRKRRMQRHKRSVLAVSAVVLLLFVVVSANSISLKSKEKEYLGQEQDLEQQIKKEKARAEEIEALREYVGTDQYVEDIAREKLGLVHENEIVLKEK
jgi:cell division protein DivIC